MATYWSTKILSRVWRERRKFAIGHDEFEAMLDAFKSLESVPTLAKDPRVRIIARPLPKPFTGSIYRLRVPECRELRGFIFVALNGKNGKRGTLVLLSVQPRTPWTYDEALDELLAELAQEASK